jgi:endoglucanase
LPSPQPDQGCKAASDAPAVARAPVPAATRLFNDGPYWSDGGAVTITVFARGRLERPVHLSVSASHGGSFSKTALTLSAGEDSSDSFSFTPPAGDHCVLRYTAIGCEPPAPHPIYTLADPLTRAATEPQLAAQALLARLRASCWDMAHARPRPQAPAPAGEGEALHAVADSGFGATRANAMEMLNWIRDEPSGEARRVPPVMRRFRDRWCSDHSAPSSWGFWCRAAAPMTGSLTPLRRRMPYHLRDAHFAIVVLAVPQGGRDGVVFQASQAQEGHTAQMALVGGRPQARWRDAAGREVLLTGAAPLVPGQLAVVSLCSAPGRQVLRVDGVVADTAQAHLGSGNVTQMLIGWGFRNYVPDPGFEGLVFAVVTGKGNPTPAELHVLESHLANCAGRSR